MLTTRRSSATAAVLVVLTLPTGCDRIPHTPDDYLCKVREDTLGQAVDAKASIIKTGATATRTLAVAVDPQSRNRSYTATLFYDLAGGAEASTRLGVQIGGWVKRIGPSAQAAVQGTTGVGFAYVRPDEDEAEDLLGEKWPPGNWHQLIISLGLGAAGRTQPLPAGLAGRVTLEAQAKAHLTLLADKRFRVRRSVHGRFEGKPPTELLRHFGMAGEHLPKIRNGRFAISYEVSFDADARPRRLTTTADMQRGRRLEQVTRSLDLRTETRLGRQVTTLREDPFHVVTAEQLFFRSDRLWSRLAVAGTTHRTTYDVEAEVDSYPLDLGPFGMEYRQEQIKRKLVESRVHSRGGRHVFSCSGNPAVPDPPKKSRRYTSISPDRIPAPSVSPSPSSPAPSPSPGADAEPEASASGGDPSPYPTGPVDPSFVPASAEPTGGGIPEPPLADGSTPPG